MEKVLKHHFESCKLFDIEILFHKLKKRQKKLVQLGKIRETDRYLRTQLFVIFDTLKLLVQVDVDLTIRTKKNAVGFCDIAYKPK